jgi:hypothetical protein
VRILAQDASVKELIDEDTNWWKVPLIKKILNKEEVESICSMAISPNRQLIK